MNWELEAAASLLSSSFILPKRPTAAPATTSGKDGWQEEGNGGRKENLFKGKRNDKDKDKDSWQEEGNGGRKENLFKEKRNDKDKDKDGWQEEGNGGRKENLFKEKRNDKDQRRNNNHCNKHYNKQTIISLFSWQKINNPPIHPSDFTVKVSWFFTEAFDLRFWFDVWVKFNASQSHQ